MEFLAKYKNGAGYAIKSIDAESVTDALFLLAVKYPNLNFDRKNVFINSRQLKAWFAEKGMYL